MERRIDLAEISDGKRYGSEDMVKAGCADCQGCSACCRGMGDSILLDPYDVCRLSEGLKTGFEELMKGAVGLTMADGLILPHLKMAGESESCSFLDENGRCSIHSFRPGFCRLFPLGRIYENGSFWYFLQIHECRKNAPRYGSENGWIFRSLPVMRHLSVTGIILQRIWENGYRAWEQKDRSSPRSFASMC